METRQSSGSTKVGPEHRQPTRGVVPLDSSGSPVDCLLASSLARATLRRTGPRLKR